MVLKELELETRPLPRQEPSFARYLDHRGSDGGCTKTFIMHHYHVFWSGLSSPPEYIGGGCRPIPSAPPLQLEDLMLLPGVQMYILRTMCLSIAMRNHSSDRVEQSRNTALAPQTQVSLL